MNKKSTLLGLVAVLGLFVVLFLITPVFARSGFGQMMGNYNGQNWGPNGCPFLNSSDRGNVGNNGNGWGMMNGYGRGMMENWR